MLKTYPRVVVNDRAAAVLAMISITVLWALIETLGGLLGMRHSPYQTVWTRYAAHLLFMLVVLGPHHRTDLVRTAHPGWQIGRGALMIGMPVAYIVGVHWMRLDDVLAVFWLSPLFVLGLAALFLRERVPPVVWATALAGWVGAELIERPDRGVLSVAAILPLGMAFCFSLYVVLTRAMRDEKRVTSLFYTALVALIGMSPVMPFVWQPPAPGDLAIMVLIGLAGLALLAALDKMCELAPISAVMPVLFLQPVWLGLMDMVRLGRVPGRLELLGALLIIGATVYAVRRITSEDK